VLGVVVCWLFEDVVDVCAKACGANNANAKELASTPRRTRILLMFLPSR
jgi:hypothetical protein